MQKETDLKEHSSVSDVLIIAKKGMLKIKYDGKEISLLAGEHLLLAANTKHSVIAVTDIEFYLLKLAPDNNNEKDIQTRQNIELLVKLFYDKVKKDELLAPVFNKQIPTEQMWSEHLGIMNNFWETVLFAEQAYRGNPFPKHLNLEISPEHFTRWISLFNETVNENFSGKKAEEIKDRADKMRQVFESKLFTKFNKI
jgi:hemoglobin